MREVLELKLKEVLVMLEENNKDISIMSTETRMVIIQLTDEEIKEFDKMYSLFDVY
jgi:hypothetical protein